MGFFYSQLFVTPKVPTTSLKGQTAIVTGSNVGLGKEAARHITRLGASKVILAVRNLTAGEEARQDIITSTKCSLDTIEVWKLDLSSYESVQAFARKADANLDRLDMLLENAGIASAQWNLAEGHERTITINVISTFLLAFLLLPKLRETANRFQTKPRLTIVSSEVHGWTEFPEWKSEKGVFAALDDQASARIAERYPTSKLLEVLVLRQIMPQFQGSGIIVNYLNPGLCKSELGREGSIQLTILKFFLARTTEVGSRTLVAAAVGGEETHGKYMHDGVADDGVLSPFVQSADGQAAGKKVWLELKDILENIQSGVTKGF